MATLAKAIRIASQVHEQQFDKGGDPYILHPLRVMARVTTGDEKIVAVLHDVVEDGEGWTFERLRDEGFSETVIEALKHVTKLPGEEDDYDAFIRRAAKNAVASRVKLADLEDNLDLKRIKSPTQKDFERITKYHKAWVWLRGDRST